MNPSCGPGEKYTCGNPAVVEIAGVIYCSACDAKQNTKLQRKLNKNSAGLIYDRDLGTYRPVRYEEERHFCREEILRECYRATPFGEMHEEPRGIK